MKNKKQMKNKNKKQKFKLNKLFVFKENEDSKFKIGIENYDKNKIKDVLSCNSGFYKKENLSYVKNLSYFIGSLKEALTLVAPNKYITNYNYEYTLKQLPKVLKKIKKIEECNKKQENKLKEREFGL